MIRKNPCHDIMTPAGQIINKVAQQNTMPKEVYNVTWEKPAPTKETIEQAYARGWADAMAEVEFNQWLDNRSN